MTSHRFLHVAVAAALVFAATGCDRVLNAPNPPDEYRGNVLFTSFQEQPKYLDPARSYNNNETPWMYSIYEPPLQYHYLKRPYQLEGRTAVEVPQPVYYDAAGRRLPDDVSSEQVAQAVYRIHLKPGIVYQPHPAFARDAQGRYLYHDLPPGQIAHKNSPADVPLAAAAQTTRPLRADDYVYQIKRQASPWVPSPLPLYELLSHHVIGLKELREQLTRERDAALAERDPRETWLPWRDLREVEFPGARALDDTTFEIRLNGKYPQFKYWLAMTFFAPVPWEADKFYAQRGMTARGLTLNTWPVGTGAYMLTEQGPTRYVMERNPNFRDERYPADGNPGDREADLLADAGRRLPFIDKVVSTLEKERNTTDTKFLQGYYDAPDIERNDSGTRVDREVKDGTGRAALIRERGFRVPIVNEANSWYMGFNMLDPVVGHGKTPDEDERRRKLRQAISIATDWEDHAEVFTDIYGTGTQVAMSPLPPTLFGYRDGAEGVNPITHRWVDGRAERRSLDEAKKLLTEAGYPDGRDAATGKPLVLYYDSNGLGPAYQARLDWQVKQAAKLGVQLEIRAADYNRFQERMLKGAHQLFFWGWLADYPDPENFLFLLYGPQSKVKNQGENTANYENPEYDRLFERMRDLPDGPERQQLIDQMVRIVRDDAPWMFGVFPASTYLHQGWLHNYKPTLLAKNNIQYLRLDYATRWQKIEEWNRPRWLPLAPFGLLLIPPVVFGWRILKRRDAATAAGVVAATPR
ncbi:MAG: ABC transporter substrate-binding protein [Betaproteobacteria bacterium]